MVCGLTWFLWPYILRAVTIQYFTAENFFSLQNEHIIIIKNGHDNDKSIYIKLHVKNKQRRKNICENPFLFDGVAWICMIQAKAKARLKHIWAK